MNKLTFSAGKITRAEISHLHTALEKLKLTVSPQEVGRKTIGETTTEAIREIQRQHGLDPDGQLNERTIGVLNAALFETFYASSKTRTARLQALLEKAGLPIETREKNSRKAGGTTRAAIETFQRNNNLPADGKITEALVSHLQEAAVKATLGTKTQVGKIQAMLLQAGWIAKLKLEISADELKKKVIGPTTIALIKSFQEKYQLRPTGEIDAATLTKLQSVVSSRGVRKAVLKPTQAGDLTVIKNALRLNMKTTGVNTLQRALTQMGYSIAAAEFSNQQFGATTRSAVLGFQKSNGLPETGHVEKETLKAVNAAIGRINPAAATDQYRYRIRGSVRDEVWNRTGNRVLRVYELDINGKSEKPLVTKKNHTNGFFDIIYDPPIDPLTGKPKEKFHLLVEIYQAKDSNPANDVLVTTQTHYNVKRVHWVNFTEGGSRYKGTPVFSVTSGVLQKALGQVKVEDLVEKTGSKQISQLSLQTGVDTDSIMRLVLAGRVANNINNKATLPAEVFYAFIRQNIPPDMPGDLLAGTADWETIDQLTENVASGIVFIGDEILQQALDNAIANNLVSQTVRKNRDGILKALSDLRLTFVLEKPILIGNEKLQSLLALSSIAPEHYQTVAGFFIRDRGINEDFWTDLNGQADTIGADAIRDFQTTVELGNIAKNHLPTIQYVRNNLSAGLDMAFSQASDMAKLSTEELVTLIQQNGNQVPDNIPGDTVAEKVNNYAGILKARAEAVFPAVALVASVKRNNIPAFDKIGGIEEFIDAQPGLNFRTDNIDKYLKDHAITLDDATRNQLKTVQRIHKLTADATTGTALLQSGLYSSAQVYFTGQSRLIGQLTQNGVDEAHARKVYEGAKIQYMQILGRLMNFSPKVNWGTPEAIISPIYTAEELHETLGDVPDLETLFGSLDFCACDECNSLYGPAAYLTDLLRFLKTHDSLIVQSGHTLTIKDTLFDRRPDIGRILLNCENTDTPLPYIDLVCEILENNFTPQQKDFDYQTTATRAELRAIPQYIRPAAYMTLATADYPMNSSFNLWQSEAATYLQYLRVPRYDLMERFQDISNPGAKIPTDLDIAATFFSFSLYETDLVITQRDNVTDQNRYWFLDTSQTSIPVSDFLSSTRLSYEQLLELLLVRFLNDPDASDRMVVTRPADTCDTSVQQVTNLTPQRFDLLHRFLRLWEKTNWKMWELDLLIRNPKIGANALNGDTLINLKKAKQLQDALSLPVEMLVAFYDNLNTEQRIQPDNPDLTILPLYNILFQNTNLQVTLDTHFALPLDHSIILDADNAGYNPSQTLLSALALRQPDLDLLIPKTDDHLSLESLSALFRYAYLARSLRLSVKDLLLLLGIMNLTDPFDTVQTTWDCLDNLGMIRDSGLSLTQLDYILNDRPDSPAGLREETIAQLVGDLRRILQANRDSLDQLSLSESDRTTILSFDTDGLQPMPDGSIPGAILPLQNILSPVLGSFRAARFSVEESAFIVSFDGAHITPASKTQLIDSIRTVQQNLSNLLQQNDNQVSSQVAGAFGLANEQASLLLHSLVLPGQAKTLLEILSDNALLDTNPDGSFVDISRAQYPLQYQTYTLLHKLSILITGMGMTTEDLDWFNTNHTAVHTIDFAALPVTTAVPPNQFADWLNLYRFLSFKSAYPEPEDSSIRSILDLAKNSSSLKSDIIAAISALTTWPEEDLQAMDDGFHLQHTTTQLDYTDAALYKRLQKCFAAMKLTGVDATALFKWALRSADLDRDMEIARETRQAIKSKYEQDDWLQKITPLQDDLREKKRSALAEYLMETSRRTQPETVVFGGKNIKNILYWKDSNDLYRYFLIDVQMSACQLTSRIKQAISSVQLYIQRCFLNFERPFVEVTLDEKEDTASLNAWSQWKWMKNYRIWEANRKVFFYPENWILPELRDDKSPFFQELENDILQNEVTDDNVEAAFLNYLHKVDEVSRLDVCGLYHELEELNTQELGFEINNVHVIGRTKSAPQVYYYRKYDMNYATWTAWEKIDVDIAGDHVIPVVYNRKLHLFWLVVSEKPLKTKKLPPAEASASDSPGDTKETPKSLEIQLGWSILKTSGWTAKKISKQKLVHPWERPLYSYNLRPYYFSKLNELYLDIYISTSREFNDATFYDPYQDRQVRLTDNPFNETFLPWHSSSFIFDGEVKDLKLKALAGSYHLMYNAAGQPVDPDAVTATDSYTYVHNNFGDEGEEIESLQPVEFGPRLRLPNGLHFSYTRLTNNVRDAANPHQLRVLENTSTATLLGAATNPFELVITQQEAQQNALSALDHPMFYQDSQRAFFIKPEWLTRLDGYGRVISHTRKYRFLPFYHPYTTLFIRELNRSGLDGLLNRKIQTVPQTFPPVNTFHFSSYSPAGSVIADDTAQTDIVDFSFGGAFSIYNWELFFHAPLMIACRLSQNQRFEEAMRWFHYIFDPTNIEVNSVPQRYWITKPFFAFNADDERQQRIENILTNLDLPENKEQLKAWRNHPFNPHLIARYRPVAYQKTVVMKYIDNLIAWGDQLFRQDSIESINQASLLYILAYEILGRRPEKVPNVAREDQSFDDLESKLDEFGNASVDVIIENTLLPIEVVPSGSSEGEALPHIDTLYFCIPNNDTLLQYWDTVEDRLFKIRHCMNIEGVVRQLPLFEPPIDPALLVKAAAAGIDLSSVLDDLSVGTPHYRFRVVVQKAIEFCENVRTVGEKLLSALEKKDAEGIALLRSQQEIDLQTAIKVIKQKQVDEAEATIGSLNKTLEIAQDKKEFYSSRDFMNAAEIAGVTLTGVSLALDTAVSIGYIWAGVLKAIPDFIVGASGFGGSPHATADLGGDSWGESAKFASEGLGKIAETLMKAAEMSYKIGEFQRRSDEWQHEVDDANLEIEQAQFQIQAAEIRQAIAEKDLENQEMLIDNARAADDYMRSKYTNQQLYSWMISQLSAVYFQAYQLAYDMAKKAERCYQYELGLQSSNLIQFGYWDSLKKGLLSGDKLMNDLRRLEAAYLDQNERELEITRHISLAQMAPLTLITLKETGKCTLSLPEWLFDMDYPGHYMRRIKSVSVTIPCVAGPYTSINATLSLLKSDTRISNTVGGSYNKTDDDIRFRTQMGAISSIATSHGQQDSGLFELNFNDDRYLPFEGAGVISDWQINMPLENNYFDFNSVSDFILHINYTARDGGGLLADAARSNLNGILPNSTMRLFSLKHEFGTEWYQFLHPSDGNDQELVINLGPEYFPFFIRGKLNTLKIKRLDIFAQTADSGDCTAQVKVTTAAYSGDQPVSPDADFNNVHHLSMDLSGGAPAALGEFRMKIRRNADADFKSLADDTFSDIFILLQLGT